MCTLSTYQHDCLKMGWTRIEKVMTIWIRDSPQRLNSTQRTKGNQASKKSWEKKKSSSPGNSLSIGCSVPNVDPWQHTYKLHYTDWEICVFMCWGV